MKESETQKNEKKKITKIKTFSIPFDLEKFEEKTTTDTSKNSEEDIIKEAFKYHSQGNTSEATKYYQQLINQGCNDFRVFSNYGVILKNLGKLKEAEISTRKAIELKPDFAEAHSNLGTILKDLGKLKEAEFYQRKAIEFKSGFAAAHNNLGNILKDLGKFKEAEFEYQKSHDINFIQNIDSKFKEDCLKNISLSKSQFRQDLFALSQLNFKKNGFFVEFGSCDGLVGSNSYLLEKFFNWNGILAEPAISWHTKLRENRSVNIETKCVWKSSDDEILFYEPFHRQLATIDIYSKNEQKLDKRGKRYKVKTISLLDLLERNNAPKFIDYLSIDTEGSEYEILNAFDFQKYKFKVITCEHNYTPIREKVYNLLIKKGYKRKLTNISRFEDWYVYDF